MQARTREGRSYRLLTILDEYSRECQAIVVGRRLTHNDVIEHLATLVRAARSSGSPEK